MSCTVVAHDQLDECGLNTGVLGSLGMSIARGEAFTYRESDADGGTEDSRVAPDDGDRGRRRDSPRTRHSRTRIVDWFIGPVGDTAATDFGVRATEQLELVLGFVEHGDAAEARRHVDGLVAGALRESPSLSTDL